MASLRVHDPYVLARLLAIAHRKILHVTFDTYGALYERKPGRLQWPRRLSTDVNASLGRSHRAVSPTVDRVLTAQKTHQYNWIVLHFASRLSSYLLDSTAVFRIARKSNDS